jgi:hypothetical protein
MQPSKTNFWKKKIEAWECSGLSQPQFCRREKLTLSAFHYWRNRLLNKRKPQFVKVEAGENKPGKIRLYFDPGVQIDFDPVVPVQTIGKVLETVNEVICTSIGKK